MSKNTKNNPQNMRIIFSNLVCALLAGFGCIILTGGGWTNSSN